MVPVRTAPTNIKLNPDSNHFLFTGFEQFASSVIIKIINIYEHELLIIQVWK